MSGVRKLCKPSRKLFEQECRRLENEIQALRDKLSEIKSCLTELFSKLDALKTEKTKKFTEKNELESTVRLMSVDINKLSERLAQLQSKIHYRDMRKLEDAIRKLQTHLDSHHFKLSEEKKIVAEIDKLNRSKRVVGEFLEVQSALKELRSNQYSKRAERDTCMKAIASIRSREEMIKGEINVYKLKETQHKTDMDDLYEQRKLLKSDFTKQQQDYAQHKEALKAEQQQIKKNELEQQKMNKKVHHMCIRPAIKIQSLSKEAVTCQQLIEFCERLAKSVPDEKTSQKQRKRPISYTTDVLSKFITVDISPPMTAVHAASCLVLLKQKLAEFTQSPSDETDTKETELLTEITEITATSSRQSSSQDLLEAQLPDDGSDASSLSRQYSLTSDIDVKTHTKEITSILDSLVTLSVSDSSGCLQHLA